MLLVDSKVRNLLLLQLVLLVMEKMGKEVYLQVLDLLLQGVTRWPEQVGGQRADPM